MNALAEQCVRRSVGSKIVRSLCQSTTNYLPLHRSPRAALPRIKAAQRELISTLTNRSIVSSSHTQTQSRGVSASSRGVSNPSFASAANRTRSSSETLPVLWLSLPPRGVCPFVPRGR